MINSGLLVESYTKNAKYCLNKTNSYTIDIKGVNRGGPRCTIEISYSTNKWGMFFIL